jgi:hypothetical protein
MSLLRRMHRQILFVTIVALSCGVLNGAHAQGATDSAVAERNPSVHEFRAGAFRESDYRDPRFLDSRYHHDHYYPPIGFAFGAVPSGHEQVYDPDGDLYFARGVWYREEQPERYVVVSPEIGTTVAALPPYYTTVSVQGVPYYYANHVYYLQAPDGYLVVLVDPPSANAAVEKPSGNAAAQPPSSGPVTESGTGRN